MTIPTFEQKRDGLLRGLGLAPAPEPTGPGERILGAALLEAMGGAELDVPRLIASWTRPSGLVFECPVVAASIAWLTRTQAPIPDGEVGPGFGATVVTLGLAAGLHGQPANLVSGTYHLARLLDPHPVGIFAAVAGAVTAACFLTGRRDFVPAVLDVLLANDAPAELVEELRRVPVWARGRSPQQPAGVVSDLGTVLWAVRHHPSAETALAAVSGLGPLARRLGLGLVGARDGVLELTAASTVE